MKVKICGITNVEDAKLVGALGADAIGFIFYKKSKRYVTPEQAKNIIEQIPPFVLKVGVFVNESAEAINKISKEIKLNLIQLHGDELPEIVDNIDFPVVKAFRVNDEFDYSTLSKYKDCSFLLDAYDEIEYGGTGQKFDWENIPEEFKSKIILAGGISSDNIDKIFREINPYAVDVSSSLEVAPGKKDHIKLKQFFEKLNELRKD